MAESSDTDGPARGPAAIIQHGLDRNLSDVSEHPELPNEDEHARVNGDASMLSAAPSSNVMLGVHAPQITSPQRACPPPRTELQSPRARIGSRSRGRGPAGCHLSHSPVATGRRKAPARERLAGRRCGDDWWRERW